MLDSLYQSLVMFFVAQQTYWDSDIGIFEFGTTIATSCLITMLVHCAIDIQSWVCIFIFFSGWIQILYEMSNYIYKLNEIDQDSIFT